MSDAPENLRVAEFDLGSSQTRGEYVVRSGLIFRAGDYPDKKFTVTPEDLKRIAAEFSAVDVNTSHLEDPVLAGVIGRLEAVWLSSDGTELHGQIALKTAFEALVQKSQHRVSLEFDRETKRITGIAIVKNPRVADAVVFEGEPKMAEPKKGLLQRFMDAVTGLPGGKELVEKFEAEPVTEEKPAPVPTSEKTAPAEPETITKAAFDAALTQREAERVKLEARIAELEGNDLASKAAAFADDAIRAGKAMPAERALLIAQFSQASKDDKSAPVKVTFGEGKEGGRVDLLRAEIAARPSHNLTTEQLEQGEVAVLFGQKSGESRADAILEMTPLGRAAKARKKKEAA